jgi:FixJ family two-component response regulator
MERQTTVMVVDDERDVCDCVAQVVGNLGVAVRCFTTGHEVLEFCTPDLPGCLLLDMQITDMSGLAVREQMVARECFQPFIMLSGRSDIACAVEAMHLGARDFLQKPFDRKRLLARVEDALAWDAAERTRRAAENEILKRVDTLTARERQVLQLVGAGRITKQIARDLTISPKTVEVHRSNIMRKMHVDSAAELLHLVARNPRISSASTANEKRELHAISG